MRTHQRWFLMTLGVVLSVGADFIGTSKIKHRQGQKTQRRETKEELATKQGVCRLGQMGRVPHIELKLRGPAAQDPNT